MQFTTLQDWIETHIPPCPIDAVGQVTAHLATGDVRPQTGHVKQVHNTINMPHGNPRIIQAGDKVWPQKGPWAHQRGTVLEARHNRTLLISTDVSGTINVNLQVILFLVSLDLSS